MEALTDEPFYYFYNDSTADNKSLDWDIILDCPSPHLQGANVFLPIIYSVIFVVGIMGNVLVIAVVGHKSSRLVDTFVVNLALADLVFVLTLPLWAVSAGQDGRWDFGPAGNLLCKLSSYVIAVNRVSNISFLTCMSVDRYLAVVKLLDSRNIRNSRCVRATCAGIWSGSLVLGIPSLVYRRVGLHGNAPSCVEDSSSYFFLGLSLLTTLLTFIVPVVVLVLCYGAIVVRLSKHSVGAANPRSGARRRHSVKMVLSIIVAFVVSWLPFNVFKLIATVSQLLGAGGDCGGPPWQRDGLLVSCCLAFLNSCVNPVIYFCLDHHFRRRAEVLLRACVGRPQRTNTSTTGTNAGTSENWMGADRSSHV